MIIFPSDYPFKPRQVLTLKFILIHLHEHTFLDSFSELFVLEPAQLAIYLNFIVKIVSMYMELYCLINSADAEQLRHKPLMTLTF